MTTCELSRRLVEGMVRARRRLRSLLAVLRTSWSAWAELRSAEWDARLWRAREWTEEASALLRRREKRAWWRSRRWAETVWMGVEPRLSAWRARVEPWCVDGWLRAGRRARAVGDWLLGWAWDGVLLVAEWLDAGPLGPPIGRGLVAAEAWLGEVLAALDRREHRAIRRGRNLWPESLEPRGLMAGAISGVVFEDFNANGVHDTGNTVANSSGVGSVSLAQDAGLGGVTVRAFDGSNVLRGSAVTGVDGTFAFTPSGVGPYRVEYTGLPAGFAPGPFGPDSASAVRIVPDSGTATANLGAVLPSDFLQNNPVIVTSCYVSGDQINGPNAAVPVLVSFPFAAGSNSATGASSYTAPATHDLAVPANKLGTTWGLGYNPATRLIYAGAYMRRHAGYGPDGTGAIYAIDPNGGVTLFADLNAIFGPATAGPNAHDTSNYDTDNGNVGWDAVGKTSLGGLDLSADGSTLYVMDLADRRLYALPTSGTLDATTVRSVSIPLNAPGATGTNGADLRPFAVQWHDGKLYVGIVNSAESTGQASDLRAYVYTVDPATLQFGAAPVFQMALNYPRASPANSGSSASGNWNPWTPTFTNLNNGATIGVDPQPMLSGLAFDPSGNLVLAFRDRFGDQTGSFNLSNPASPAQRVDGVSVGDTIRAFINTPGNLSSGWTLENNARGPAGQGNGPQGNGQGPGGGEFYFQDNHDTDHLEVTIGGVLQIPGTPDVIVNAFDPGLSLRTGGPIWFNNQNGSKTKAYQLYVAPDTGQPGVTFGKTNGLGDLIALGDPAPVQVGDRVFRDLNNNGIQDPNEPGIAGVTVHLFQGATLVGTTTTDPTGQYLFGATNVTGGLKPATPYQIRFDNPANFASGGVLNGLTPTVAGASVQAGSKAVTVGGFPTITFQTAGLGVSDFTLDAGFVQPPTSQVCGVVFVDVNSDGKLEAGEPTIAGASVTLTGTNDLNAPVSVTLVTGSDGSYCFSGLRSGTYQVTRVLPSGFDPPLVGPTIYSSIAVIGGTDVLNEDFPARLSVAPAPLSGLSGSVYFDLNHNGTLDDATDFGIAGVTVRLTGVDDLGNTVNLVALTDDNGGYSFDQLQPGTYTLHEVQPQHFRDYIDTIGTQGGTVHNDTFSNIVLTAGTFGTENNFGELRMPNCRLSDLAITIGRRYQRDQALRNADPAAFDALHPRLGAVLAQGEVPRGFAGFPLAPLAYRLVPTLGTKVIPFAHGEVVGSNPVPLRQKTGPVAPRDATMVAAESLSTPVQGQLRAMTEALPTSAPTLVQAQGVAAAESTSPMESVAATDVGGAPWDFVRRTLAKRKERTAGS